MAEINSFLSPTAQKELDSYEKSLVNIATQYTTLAKSMQAVNTKTKTATKDQKSLDTVTIERNKLLKQQQTLTAKQDKSLEELTRQTIKLKEAEKNRITTIKNEKDAYAKLNTEHKKALATAKTLAAQYGTTSTQAKKATAAANKMGNELKKIDSSVGQSQRKVGSYGKSLLNFAGQLGLVTGAAAIFKKGLDVAKESILSIQTTGDKWTNSLAGLKEGYNSFIRGLASGTSFKDLIQNFKDATKAGSEYSAILDDLGDLQRSLRISESEARLEQEKLLTTTRNVSKSDKERLDAIEKFIVIEKDITSKRVENAKKTYAAELLIAKERSGLSQNEIEDFLRNQEAYIDATQKRAIASDKISEQQKSINSTTIEGLEDQKKLLNELLVERTDEEKSIDRIIENAAQLDDTMRDRLVGAYESLVNVETSSLKMSQRVFTMRGSLLKSMESEKNKVNELVTVKGELVEIEEDISDELITINDNLNAELDAANEQAEKNFEDHEKAKTEISKRESEQRKEIALLALSSTSQAFDSFFQIAQNQRDAELDSINASYQAQITAAEGNTELQTSLANKLEIEQNRIRLEQWQADQNQALSKIAFNTAIGITSALTSIPPNVPLSVAIGIIGGLQAIAVKSQEPPAFFMGTTDSPHTFIAGDRDGTETIIKPSGEVEFTPDKATLYSGKEYEHSTILPNDQTRSLLRKSKSNDNKELVKRIDKLISVTERNNTNIHFSKNVGRLNKTYFKARYKKDLN